MVAREREASLGGYIGGSNPTQSRTGAQMPVYMEQTGRESGGEVRVLRAPHQIIKHHRYGT